VGFLQTRVYGFGGSLTRGLGLAPGLDSWAHSHTPRQPVWRRRRQLKQYLKHGCTLFSKLSF